MYCSNYDNWKTTNPDEENALNVGEIVCPYCDGEAIFEDEDGKHLCPDCKGRGCIDEAELGEPL